MRKSNIALLGYGTVGKGVEILLKNEQDLHLQAILRRTGKAEGPLMTDKIEDIVNDPSIDIVVEAMGGLEPAHTYLREAILHHKHIVTANKALVNAYGEELNQLAIQNKVSFLFSAACGGGIPYLPTLVQAKKHAAIDGVGGILNGTTNFILDKMEREGLPFDEALKLAQSLGYAEADPSGDLNGTDTMYKLRLAMAVACQVWLDPKSILVSGIQDLKAVDIAFFKTRHWAIRLLATGNVGYSRFTVHVEPTLVNDQSFDATILENNNLIWFNQHREKTVLTGQGAGSIPTATNILRDLNAIHHRPKHLFKDSSPRFLSDKMRSAFAENGADGGSYYVRASRSISSSFLDQHQVERFETDAYTVTITDHIQTKTMHEEMSSLRQKGEVFFAKIA